MNEEIEKKRIGRRRLLQGGLGLAALAGLSRRAGAQAVFVPSKITDIPGLSNALTTTRQPFCFGGDMVSGKNVPQSGVGLTCRVGYTATVAASSIRLYFTNGIMGNPDVSNTNDIFVKASVEDSAGNFYPVFFKGQRTATIGAGGDIWSDPVDIEILSGAMFYTRTFASVSVNTQYIPSLGIQNNATLGSDATDSGSVGTSPAYSYYPSAIDGITTQRTVAVGVVGDSIAYGFGDTSGGYLVRALNGLLPLIRSAVPGDQLAYWVGAGRHLYRTRSIYLSGCTHAICQEGVNDFSSGYTLSTMQANALLAWGIYSARRIKVYQCTLTPCYVTSTDGFVTVTNQTPLSTDGVRTGFNDWLRDGAPINPSGVAVAIGTSATGTLRAGMPAHPLSGFFEIADTVESTRNSGKWAAPSGAALTGDGIHPNAAGHTLAAGGIVLSKMRL